ncbi:hypothetical protein [Burkholderia stabilis]|uniref:hypothetical protein n=1 Tax=Burkholderia stabilis TaxID=95485 RepID=UPI001FC85490|nr:hypothetical protein [Burkholderia stabilis]
MDVISYGLKYFTVLQRIRLISLAFLNKQDVGENEKNTMGGGSSFFQAQRPAAEFARADSNPTGRMRRG